MLHLGLEQFVPTTLYVLAVLAFFASIFWRPYAGLLFLVPLLPLQNIRYRLHPYFLGSLLVDVMLLGVIIGLKLKGEPVFPKTPFNKVIAVFAVYTYLSLWRGALYLGSEAPLWFDNRRLQDWKNYLVIFLIVFLAASAIKTTREMKWMLMAMSFGLFMLNKYYIGTVSGRDFSQFSYDLRYDGSMGHAGVNGLAAFEAQIGAFLLAFNATIGRLHWRLPAYGLLAMNVTCLIYALSRGGYAAFLIGCVFVALLRQRSLILVLIAFAITWQGLVPKAVEERIFMTKGEDGQIENSAGSRLNLWDEALRVFEGDAVFGTGFNTYAYRQNYGGYGDTHNLFVKILVETGAFGLLLFIFLLGKMYRAGYHLYKTAEDPFLKALGFGFAALVLAAAVANFFGDRWTYPQITGYTLCLLGLVLRGQQIVDAGAESGEGTSEDAELEEIPA